LNQVLCIKRGALTSSFPFDHQLVVESMEIEHGGH
jgi:hypothetical protein